MTPAGGTAPLVGLLLAAGRGARFDASGQRDKLLATVNNEPVALLAARHLRSVVDRLLIVIRPGAQALAQSLASIDATVLECPDAAAGMGHSLAFGVAQALRLFAPRALLVALADMPYIRNATLLALTHQVLNDEVDFDDVIAAPRFNGQRGHPVLFGRGHFAQLQQSLGDTGAARLLRADSVHWIDVDDPGVIRDIDRPQDLPSALE